MKYRDPSPQLVLHEALLKIKHEYLPFGKYSEMGICASVTKAGTARSRDQVDCLLYQLMSEWPKGTGRAVFPVPGSIFSKSRECAIRKYQKTNNKWKGLYGRRRKALLDWLINQTTPGQTP